MKTLNQWVNFMTRSELPALRHTARDLNALAKQPDHATVNDISHIISHDPVMTVKLLRYLQQNKHRMQQTEIIQIEQALLMMGVETFFNKVPATPVIETELQSHLDALPPLLRVVHRSHRASRYAKAWAVQLHDLHYEEIRVAALLHDIAEILMWYFAPDDMLSIYQQQKQNRQLRSRDIQTQVFGFPLIHLQHQLAVQWGLPELLLTLMDDDKARWQRVRNVILAVNLARHSANGWDDAALDDDFKDISDLLRLPVEMIKQEICQQKLISNQDSESRDNNEKI